MGGLYPIMLLAIISGAGTQLIAGESRREEPSEIDQYVAAATARSALCQPTPGSLYSPAGLLGDIARDLRARQVDDIVTILVADRAAAVSRGTTNTSRKSDASGSINSMLGPAKAGGALANLLSGGGSRKLQGQGETSRETVLSTTITARVVQVLPNGYLVVEGAKEVRVNSEHQQVRIRGVVRWSDIGAGNQVSSDRLANLEVHVNGKGVVGDAVKRPNFLYRLLLGLLPF